MLLTTIRTLLAGTSAVTAICADRIEMLTLPQGISIPAVCLSIASTTPVNGLETWNGLDGNLVQLDCYGATYTDARALAEACRMAMETDHELETEFDNFDESAELSGLARVTQQYSVWS